MQDVRSLLADLKANLADQDRLNKAISNMRRLGKHNCAQLLIDKLTEVYSRQGVIVAMLKLKGYEEYQLAQLIYA